MDKGTPLDKAPGRDPLDKGTPLDKCPTCDLVRTLLIPRLDQLESEVKMLRDVTWPVCQGIVEDGNPLSFSTQKRKYFSLLYKDEAIELLDRKAEFTGIKDGVIRNLELDWINSSRSNE